MIEHTLCSIWKQDEGLQQFLILPAQGNIVNDTEKDKCKQSFPMNRQIESNQHMNTSSLMLTWIGVLLSPPHIKA